jgi:hypothetical protein
MIDREPQETAERAFDRQVANLLDKGYPHLAGLTEAEFVEHVSPLRERVCALPTANGPGRTPFAVVVTRDLVPPAKAIGAVELAGRRGFTTMEGDDLERFAPLDGLDLPRGSAYVVADVDTGGELVNVTPDEALPRIVAEGRSPLTIDEGIAVVTQFPELLVDENCFSLPGSRCGDRRVTAIWLSEKRPRLGWCWAGNPHAWLGSASCVGRLGA